MDYGGVGRQYGGAGRSSPFYFSNWTRNRLGFI